MELMLPHDIDTAEEGLDPQDWDAMRALGHKMLDDLFDQWRGVRDRPIWQPIPDDVKARLHVPLPHEPQSPESIYEDYLRDVLQYPMGNTHPRFWGWVIGTGTPLGVLAEMLAAGLNPNMGGGEHAAAYVESQVIEWCKEMLGYAPDASGLLVSGGSMANLVGLTVARNAMAGYNIRAEGVGASAHKMTVYTSREVHSSVQRGVEMLGLGSDALRYIPVNEKLQIVVEALEEALAQDKAAGMKPICIVGNAGTVNTGAFDDLNALADICARENIWFHVDGAFGALAALAPELRPLVDGMTRADSIAFDMHKWMYMPYEIGCTLVRDRKRHYDAFTLTPDYLTHAVRGAAAGEIWFSDYGIQLSRGFRALKAWMSIKEHGIDKYGRMIRQNVEQAQYLADLVDAAPELERMAPVSLNIVCFRYRVDGMSDEALNALNEELLIRIHEHAVAVPSYTRLNGRYAIRVAISNQRSRREDFDLFVRETLRLGRALAAEN
ncbi:MAG: aminotransferase class V-fold PLP-dependent enzyme [Anaerolineae bacterium]|nr:aminotransferase class V-fold PLP-dependent enzyme [Anaerolineae bacterium]